jgi:uncharacterized membrane-anchored protein
LPEGVFFLAKKDADAMKRRFGDQDEPSLLGVVLRPEASWTVTVSFDAEGYIKDEDGEKLDAETILNRSPRVRKKATSTAPSTPSNFCVHCSAPGQTVFR